MENFNNKTVFFFVRESIKAPWSVITFRCGLFLLYIDHYQTTILNSFIFFALSPFHFIKGIKTIPLQYLLDLHIFIYKRIRLKSVDSSLVTLCWIYKTKQCLLGLWTKFVIMRNLFLIMMRSEIFHTFQCTVMKKIFWAVWQHITPLFLVSKKSWDW